MNKKNISKRTVNLTFMTTALPSLAAEKPNILAIWGDDIRVYNISAYNRGMMGYKTPNINGDYKMVFREQRLKISPNVKNQVASYHKSN